MLILLKKKFDAKLNMTK